MPKFIIVMEEDNGSIHAFTRDDRGNVMELADLVVRGESVDIPLPGHYLWNSSNAAVVEPQRAQDPRLAEQLYSTTGQLALAVKQDREEQEAVALTGPSLAERP